MTQEQQEEEEEEDCKRMAWQPLVWVLPWVAAGLPVVVVDI
jgi:hypothetical protein